MRTVLRNFFIANEEMSISQQKTVLFRQKLMLALVGLLLLLGAIALVAVPATAWVGVVLFVGLLVGGYFAKQHFSRAGSQLNEAEEARTPLVVTRHDEGHPAPRPAPAAPVSIPGLTTNEGPNNDNDNERSAQQEPTQHR